MVVSTLDSLVLALRNTAHGFLSVDTWSNPLRIASGFAAFFSLQAR
jgi:hypothetical protein